MTDDTHAHFQANAARGKHGRPNAGGDIRDHSRGAIPAYAPEGDHGDHDDDDHDDHGDMPTEVPPEVMPSKVPPAKHVPTKSRAKLEDPHHDAMQ